MTADPAGVTAADVQVARSLLPGTVGAYLAEPSSGGRAPGVVVVPERLDEAARELCRRLAAAGFVALAPDVRSDLDRSSDPGLSEPRSDPEAVVDLDACVEHLRGHPRTAGRVGVLGMGLGGRLALILATSPAAPDRAVVSDAPGVTRRTARLDAAHPQVAVDRLPWLRAPLLWLSGETAADPDAADVAEVRAALEERGLEHRVETSAGSATGLPDVEAGVTAWPAARAWLDLLR